MTRAPGSPPLAFADVGAVAEALRERGGRLSGPRRRVLELLFAADGPVSAERLAAEGGLEPTSVYRTLESLEEMGAVRHVHVGHGPGLYALTDGREWEYLVCERCGRVSTVDAAELDAVRDLIAERFGYRARFGHFPIVGLCDACAARTARPSRRGGSMSHHHHDEHPHEHPHSHEHSHGDVTHSHPHGAHDHEHVEHEHEHSHGDHVHSHPHLHEAGLEEDHAHEH